MKNQIEYHTPFFIACICKWELSSLIKRNKSNYWTRESVVCIS